MIRQTAKREASRQRILEAAGQEFRRYGLGGIGVDGLAKSANLTSGAFYFHFRSKMQVFIAALENSLEDLKKGIEQFQQANQARWLKEFVRYYLGFKRTCDLAEGCSLPVLTPEVERAGADAQRVYQEKLREIVAAFADGLQEGKPLSRKERAWTILALLSGGVNMARAVEDEKLAEEIARAVSKAALRLSDQESKF